MNVKQLIAELEKIENKFTEIEIYVRDGHKAYCEIDFVGLPNSSRKKAILFTRKEE